MTITNLNEKSSRNYKITKARVVAQNSVKQGSYYFNIKYTILDKDILKNIGKDNYKNLLFMCNFAVNKYNKIDWDCLVENKIFTKNSIPRFRAELVKAGLVAKIKTTNGHGRYLNPMIQETGNPSNDELFDIFKEKTAKLYNKMTDY